MGWRDDWPSMPEGRPYDGKQLITLVSDGKSPFHGVWDVNLLIQEIKEHTNTPVVDIPAVDKGSNNYAGMMFGAYGLRCGPGEVGIRKTPLGELGIGLKCECERGVD